MAINISKSRCIVILGIVVAILSLQTCLHSNWHQMMSASVYYNILIENKTNEEFIKVELVQLTNIVERGVDCKTRGEVIPLGARSRITMPAQHESGDTLFLLIAFPSTRSGRHKSLPTRELFAVFLSARELQSNAGQVFPIEQDDLKAVRDYISIDSITGWIHQ